MTCALCGHIQDYIRHDVQFFGAHQFVPSLGGYVMREGYVPRTQNWEDLITHSDALWAHEIRVRLD